MQLTAILPWKKGSHPRGADGTTAAKEHGHAEDKTIPFEMDLHVPCQATGITKNGLRWEGAITTLSISSFGAQLLLPADADLEGDIRLTFKIPSPLMSLFKKKRFRIEAEAKPSGAAGPTLEPRGQKVLCVVFSEPLYFNLKS